MSQPDPTSPEVADACRRAGLPIVPDRNEANVAMSAGVVDRTMPAGDVERGLHELQVVLRQMDALFGPALAAPALRAHTELQGAYDRYRWEVEDLARRRRVLVDRCAALERRVDELVGERNRARAAAVALEQELAELGGVTVDLTGDASQLLEGLAAASDAIAVAAPTGCPACAAPVGGVHSANCIALPAAGVGG